MLNEMSFFCGHVFWEMVQIQIEWDQPFSGSTELRGRHYHGQYCQNKNTPYDSLRHEASVVSPALHPELRVDVNDVSSSLVFGRTGS
jgi:hypothetical protein